MCCREDFPVKSHPSTDPFGSNEKAAGNSHLILCGMGLDVGSQHGIDLGLVSGSLSLKPLHDIFIQP